MDQHQASLGLESSLCYRPTVHRAYYFFGSTWAGPACRRWTNIKPVLGWSLLFVIGLLSIGHTTSLAVLGLLLPMDTKN